MYSEKRLLMFQENVSSYIAGGMAILKLIPVDEMQDCKDCKCKDFKMYFIKLKV